MELTVSEQFKCSICLDFASVDPTRDYLVATKCGHIFHFLCISQQFELRTSKLCPLCRAKLVAQDLRRLVLNGIPIPECKPTTFENELQCGERKLMKIVILGNSNIGKSHILHRFAFQEFSDAVVVPTRGIDTVGPLNIDVGGERLKVMLWDLAGQDCRSDINLTMAVRTAHGIIFAYDITNSLSLDNIDYWLQFAKNYGPENAVKILVGNKTDLESERKVTKFVGQAVADKLGTKFFELSAKSGSNVEAVFRTLIANVL